MSTRLTGLSSAEAAARLIADGPNELPSQGPPGLAHIVARVLREPIRRRFVSSSLLDGVGAFAAALAVLLWARMSGVDELEMRALTFGTLIMANLMLILASRSQSWFPLRGWTANTVLVWLVGLAVGSLVLVLVTPTGRELFMVSRPGARSLAIWAGAGVGTAAWIEVVKRVCGVQPHES